MTTKQSTRRSSRRNPKAPGRPSSSSLQPVTRANPLPAAFSDMSEKIWDLDEVKAYTIRTVEEILEARQVPTHQICAPSTEITIPAIEAMRYSPLRREIVALIASTMDRQNAEIAHPSFLTILQQLTEDEIQILAAIPSAGRVLPVANLWLSHSHDHAEILHRNIMPPSIARLCSNKSRLPLYIDNLMRLQLLHEPDGAKISSARVYSNLLRQGFCTRLLENPEVRRHSTLEKRTIALSDIGDTFRKMCLV